MCTLCALYLHLKCDITNVHILSTTITQCAHSRTHRTQYVHITSSMNTECTQNGLTFVDYGLISTYCVCQTRAYCRGIVVRMISPVVRTALLTRLQSKPSLGKSLQEFLQMSDAVRGGNTSIAGSGDLKFRLHSRNHYITRTSKLRGLVQAAKWHFLLDSEEDRVVKLSPRAVVLTGSVSLNGRKWSHLNHICLLFVHDSQTMCTQFVNHVHIIHKLCVHVFRKVGTVCNYMRTGAVGGSALTIGKIMGFVQLEYTGRGDVKKNQSMFVQLRVFHHANVSILDSTGLGLYRVHKRRNIQNRSYIFVHVDRLVVFFCRVNDRDGNKSYENLVPVSRAFPD